MKPATHQQPRTDDPLDKVAQRPTSPILSGYFFGQMLAEDGFQREQLSNRHRQALLARLLVDSEGVLEGLTIQVEDAVTIRVSPGIAIDAIGRLIVVPDPETPNPLTKNGKSGPARLKLPTKLLRDDPPGDGKTVEFDLLLLPDLEPVEQSPVLASDDDGGAPVSAYEVSAYREGYRLELRNLDLTREPKFAEQGGPAFPLDPPSGFAATRPTLLSEQHRSESVRLDPSGVVIGRVSISQTGKDDEATYKIAGPPQSGSRRILPSLTDLEDTTLRTAALLDVCLRMTAMLDARLVRRSLAIVSGNGQSGPQGESLPRSISVLVTDLLGSPVQGAKVLFQLVSGMGAVGPGDGVWYTTLTVTADENGVASICWRLGLGTNFNSVEVRLFTDGETIAPGSEALSFFAWGQPPRQEVPPPAQCNPIYEVPQPSPANKAVDPPRVVGMAPWLCVATNEAEDWKKDPKLSLRFDQPMLPDDLAYPANWLRVFRISHPDGEKGLGWVKLTAVPVGGVAEQSDSAVVYRLGVISEPQDVTPDVYYLVLILDRSNTPRAVFGQSLASTFAGTALEDDHLRDLADLMIESGETLDLAISWDELVMRDGAAFPSGADAKSGGTFHASFRLGD